MKKIIPIIVVAVGLMAVGVWFGQNYSIQTKSDDTVSLPQNRKSPRRRKLNPTPKNEPMKNRAVHNSHNLLKTEPMVQQIRRRESESAVQISSEEELLAYMDELAENAEQNGRVTAADVLPVQVAVDQLVGSEQLSADEAFVLRQQFSKRMSRLSAKLRSQQNK